MGLDVQVMSFKVLERTWHEGENPAWQEHVTPNIYRHPGKFALRAVVDDKDYSHMRWTVDTSEDLSFVRLICEHFGHDGFSWHEVLALLDEYPECLEINKHVQ